MYKDLYWLEKHGFYYEIQGKTIHIYDNVLIGVINYNQPETTYAFVGHLGRRKIIKRDSFLQRLRRLTM